MSDNTGNAMALRLSPELVSAINKKRGEAFNQGAELSKHDVICSILCNALGVQFEKSKPRGRQAKTEA